MKKSIIIKLAAIMVLLVDDQIIDLNKCSSSIPSNLLAFISGGKPMLAAAKKALEKPKKAAVLKARGTKLHAPWPGRRIAMAGSNYAAHLAGMAANVHGNTEFQGDPIARAIADARAKGQWGFWKVPVECTGPNDNVPFPKRTEYLDYEGEVAIIIGKKGKDIPAAKIRDYVWGVTLCNDWSIRDGRGVPRTMSYNLAKNFDGSCSLEIGRAHV